MQATRIASRTVALIERAAELDALRGALDAAAAGAGATLVVEGAAGMGKSALLGHVASLASDAGFRTLSARTDVLERDFPYGVVRQLYEPPLREASPAERARLLDGAAGWPATWCCAARARGASRGRSSPTRCTGWPPG